MRNAFGIFVAFLAALAIYIMWDVHRTDDEREQACIESEGTVIWTERHTQLYCLHIPKVETNK